MPGVISSDFFIKWLSDLRQDMQGSGSVWGTTLSAQMDRKGMGSPMPISSYKMSVLRLGSGSRASSGQHGESSAGLRSDWRGLPIICRSCAQTRSRPAPSQVNFRCTPYPPRYTPDIAPSLALLFVIPQRSGGICFFSCPCLFSPLPVFSVVCSCCHPERSRSQSHRERLSRRTCGCLFLPLLVLRRCLFLLSS